MAEILAPRLELFGGLADLLAKPDQRVSKAVRIEIRQTCTLKGSFKYAPNGRGTAPVLSVQTERFKLASRPQRNARCREERIVVAPQLVFPETAHPLRHDPANFIADWEKDGGKGLAALCLNFSCVLVNTVHD